MAGQDERLFPNDALSLHLLHFAPRVGDKPMPTHQLNRSVGVVGNANEIGKNELPIDNIRLAGCNPIDSSPTSKNVIEGEAVTLRVATSRANSADVLTVQWKKDGVDITGTNNSVYTLASVKPEDAGVYTVTVTVSSTNLSFTSKAATLTVNAKGCGCGSGTGMALVPPLVFKAMAHRKRKKKNPQT